VDDPVKPFVSGGNGLYIHNQDKEEEYGKANIEENLFVHLNLPKNHFH